MKLLKLWFRFWFEHGLGILVSLIALSLLFGICYFLSGSPGPTILLVHQNTILNAVYLLLSFIGGLLVLLLLFSLLHCLLRVLVDTCISIRKWAYKD